jgi:hypothetical protein
VHAADVSVRKSAIDAMITKLRTGKVRLQVKAGFSPEREIIFTDAAELFLFAGLAERFVEELPNG